MLEIAVLKAHSTHDCVKVARSFCLQTQKIELVYNAKVRKIYSSIVIQELYSFKPKRTSFVNELSSTLVSFVTN
jgi:hypothetical protein